MVSRKVFFLLILGVVFIIVGILIGGEKGKTSIVNTSSQEQVGHKNEVFVNKVIDGDTIELLSGERVRYIGINAPEIKDAKGKMECFAEEAYRKNKEMVEGRWMKLEKDISEKDKFGRLLSYAHLEDLFVNDYLVRQGYAFSASYPPDVKHQEQFRQAEEEARQNNRGLWASCYNY